MAEREQMMGQAAAGAEGAELRLLRLAGPRRAAPLEREARVRAAVHGHWQRRVSGRRRLTWWWAAASLAAAAAVVAVVLPRTVGPAAPGSRAAIVELLSGEVLATNGSATSPLSLGAVLAADTTVETAAEGKAALRLPGGASLRLDDSSRLVFEAADVVRLDRGAVYVDSEAGRVSGGLVVRCELAEVREIGTQFEVRILEGGLRVRAREGVVLVRATGRNDRLTAGTEAILGADGSWSTQTIANYGAEWDWVLSTAPTFGLDGRTEGEFLRWVSRETGLELRWGDPRLAESSERTVLHGDVRGVRPDEAASVVLPTCGLSATVDGGHLLIEAAGR